MNYALFLLTVTCVAGDPTTGSTCSCCQASFQANQPTYYESPYARRPGLLERLRNRLHPRGQSVPYIIQAPVPAAPRFVTTIEPPRASGVLPATFQPEAAAKLEVPPVDKKYQEKVGCAENYEWITGQLAYVHTAKGGVWVLRYGSVDQVDPYGGSVVLAPAVDMKNYREGDLVCVDGQILKEQHAPRNLGGALYRVNTISMVIRSDM